MTSSSTSSSSIRLPIYTFIILLFDIYILVNTYNMQKDDYSCKCAQTWYLKQVLHSIMIIIALQALLLIFTLVKDLITPNKLLLILAGTFVLGFIGLQIYYIVMMLLTVHKLNKDNCTCVDKTFKNTLTYYASVRAILIVIGISIIILLSLSHKK